LPNAGDFSDEESAQGLPARVTRPISPSARGEISFQTNGKRQVLLAESTDGIEIPADAEVVIDTIQNGVARVELWSAVEQRL
jgi:hypothetical protein